MPLQSHKGASVTLICALDALPSGLQSHKGASVTRASSPSACSVLRLQSHKGASVTSRLDRLARILVLASIPQGCFCNVSGEVEFEGEAVASIPQGCFCNPRLYDPRGGPAASIPQGCFCNPSRAAEPHLPRPLQSHKGASVTCTRRRSPARGSSFNPTRVLL